jgi:preprotein translocase subunit SecA
MSFFGITSGCVSVSHQPTREDFNHQVLYGTNSDFEFPVLAYHMCGYMNRYSNISNPVLNNSQPIPTAESMRAVLHSYRSGLYREQLEKSVINDQITEWIRTAYRALTEVKINVDYVLRNGEVVVVDASNTGRLQVGCRWSGGLHEMVEIKEGCRVQAESGTIASIAHPSFFSEYEYVVAITGTAGEPQERDEILRLYGIDTFDLPPHRPCLRKRLATRVFSTVTEKWAAMIESIKQISRSRAVLILLYSIDDSLKFSAALRAQSVLHMVLNEEQQESEKVIIYRAGIIGAVTVATNTAGRGTDIKLTSSLISAGGLHVIFGFFPSNLRVECQGLGRSGRQGQQGTNQIFISQDELFTKNLIQLYAVPMIGCRSSSSSRGVVDEETIVERLYAARTSHVLSVSQSRLRHTLLERVRYAALREFFQDQWHFNGNGIEEDRSDSTTGYASQPLSVASTAVRQAYEMLRCHLNENPSQDVSSSTLLPLSVLCDRLCECFRMLWTLYFTSLSRDSDFIPQSVDDVSVLGLQLYARFLRESRWTIACIH